MPALRDKLMAPLNKELLVPQQLHHISESSALKVKVKLLRPHSKMPDRKHPGDAGFDLYADDQYSIWSHESTLVKTGIAIEIPFGYEAQVRARSGLASKNGVFAVNGVGTIDAGYRGELGVILSRVGSGPYVISRGDAIAQLVIQKLPDVCLIPAKELSESARGANGYGSTGK